MITGKSGLILLMFMTLWGCSTANDSSITLDATGKHPAGWAVASIGGLHPAAYQANKSACIECHGSALDPQSTGGISGISCFSASRSGIACHPAGPSGHPDGWSAPGNHGSAAKAAAPGLNYCTQCHGTDYRGAGVTGKDCQRCHTTAPHPATPWRGTTATGTTHTTTNLGNAPACAQCHTNKANLSSPVTPSATGTGGCFNNTLCHGVKSGHPAGWFAASSHGSSAKAAPTVSQGFLYCTQCHGAAFAGDMGPSCMTATCHAPAPHPVAANWRSTGAVTHTNTSVNNAAVCTQCHNANLKNLAQPYLARFVPAGSFGAGTAGCFNGTLCHANIIATNNCTVCHGPFSTTSFNSLAGVTATSDPKVGTHIKHLNAAIQTTAYSANIACSECHSVPGSPAVSGSHRNGVNDIVFGTLAKTGSLVPAYTPGTGVCASTYCHGASLAGGTNKAPTWNSTTYLTTAGCGTCHGFPPATYRVGAGTAAHSTSTACSGCHLHVNSTNNGFTATGVALHINGLVEASGGHSVPNYNHQAAGTGAACLACHTIGANQTYPAAILGNAPDCRGCHKKAAPGAGCGSCHGGTDGRPNGANWPDKTGSHQIGDHNTRACTACHIGLGTSGGSGSGVNHGPGNRGANPNLVGPMDSPAIVPANGTKGTAAATTCNHDALTAGCAPGVGGKAW